MTPNEEELEEAAGFAIGDSDEALTRGAGRHMAERTGCRHVLVTLGSRGMALFYGSPEPERIPVHGTDQVADVTGAGDTVLATFSLALASGATAREAAPPREFRRRRRRDEDRHGHGDAPRSFERRDPESASRISVP